VLSVVRRFEATAERVFDAWLDPAGACNWLFRTPSGTLQRCEIDARVGGGFVIAEQRGEELAEHFGTFLTIERPGLIIFTFGVDPKEPPSIVSVAIVARDRSALLTLTHEMDPKWVEWAERTRQGWSRILDGLAAALASA
jgi:uncharacterized protein YndB with AHSA1/START domain